MSPVERRIPAADIQEQAVIRLRRGRYTWTFRWEKGEELALFALWSWMARDPEEEFDWSDAAVLSRELAMEIDAAG